MKKSSMAFVAGVAVAALMVISMVMFAAAQAPNGGAAAPAQGATIHTNVAAAATDSTPSTGDSGKQLPADVSAYYNLYMQKLAGDLGVSQDKLTSSMSQAFKDTLAQAVKDGKLTQAQADERSAQWADMQSKMFALGLLPGNSSSDSQRVNCAATPQSNLQSQVESAAFQALADKLGISLTDLKQALGSGKSVADLAASKNVSVLEIKAAVINAIKPILDQAVQAHTITQAQEDSLIQTIQNADLSKPISSLSVAGGDSHVNVTTDFMQQLMEQAFQSAADKLGMTKDQLVAQLTQGKSLADIAASKNVSQADLKTAIATGIKPMLDQGVKDGKITQQQEDAAIQSVQSLDLSQNPKDLLRSLGTSDPKMCQ